MRFGNELKRLWRATEHIAHFEWLVDKVHLWPTISGIFTAALTAVISVWKNAPLYEFLVLTIVSLACGAWLTNQVIQYRTWRHTRNALRALNPNATPSTQFITSRRVAITTSIIVAVLIYCFFSMPKGGHSPPEAGFPRDAGNAPNKQPAAYKDSLYVSFSFPHPLGLLGQEVEVEIKFVNDEENPIPIENIGVIELFGNDKEQYRQLDTCYDPTVVRTKLVTDAISMSDDPTQGSSTSKNLDFVIYNRPIKLILNGSETTYPFDVLPKRAAIIRASFAIHAYEKKREDLNFFVVCPTIKLSSPTGQESVSICPGLIDMFLTKEEYLQKTHSIPPNDHIQSTTFGDKYRIIARRAGRFQLTPKIGTNSCQLITAE